MSMGKFHFTKATTEASCWCNRCNKNTLWRIVDGRRSYCIPCYDAKASKLVEKEEMQQLDMFQKGNQ